MDKIVERAREYADRHKATEINYFGVGNVYGYERIYNAELTAYERGAKEQKAIDEVNYKQGYHDAVEKAWPFVYSMYQVGRDNLTPLTKDEFIKAMEEKI